MKSLSKFIAGYMLVNFYILLQASAEDTRVIEHKCSMMYLSFSGLNSAAHFQQNLGTHAVKKTLKNLLELVTYVSIDKESPIQGILSHSW